MEIGVHPAYYQQGDLRINTGRTIMIKDTNAQNDYRINSPAGEFGILSASSVQTSGAIAHGLTTGSATVTYPTKPGNIGLIFYQAGIVVLDARMFAAASLPGSAKGGRFVEVATDTLEQPAQIYQLTGGILNSASCAMLPTSTAEYGAETNYDQHDVYALLTGSTIQIAADSLRHRVKKISFNNTTELNSSVYFCRAHHNEFNYSSNPTYLQDSKIRVKNIASDMPITYVTSVGLYSSDNELLAVAKLSEPLRKDPTNELTLRVRLDY